MRKVRLAWNGPFELRQLASGFEPAAGRPGVYLWTLPLGGELKIAYVGQAADLAERIYQHIFYTLGGAYYLYEPEDVRAGRVSHDSKNHIYSPGLSTVVAEFMPRLAALQRAAQESLNSYQYFWAEVCAWSESAARDRQLVESALITRARREPNWLLNARVSLGPRTDEILQVVSCFDGDRVPALESEVLYPERHASG